NFYSFINSYRVLEVQNRIKNLKYKDSKIMAIAFDSGFNSKTSFNRAFKNHTGITPSEYRQNVKKLKVSENKE
uniref:helix-turn-helix domain-containing protein n=1 Tax=Lacinutrix sp. TaxID=1937692 RepID=UPI0025C5409B